MNQRPIVALVATLALAAPLSGCSTTTCPKAADVPVPAAKVSLPPEIAHVYRLDFVLAPGGSYTMEVEENRNGEILVGANVPLQVAPSAASSTPGAVPPVAFVSPRQDVGLKLRAQVRANGDDVLVHTNLEWSFAEGVGVGPTIIHKMVSAGDAIVALGKPVLFQSIDDPQDKKRYQLTVTATKLR
jgi:hypothetical protein